MKEVNSRLDLMNILEKMYLCSVAVLVGYRFLESVSMIQIAWPKYFHDCVLTILITLVMVRLLLLKAYTVAEVMICFAMTALCLIAWQRNGYIEILYFLILVLGAKDIPAKRIIKTFLCTSTVLLCITILQGLTGQIENLIYHQEGRRTRMALGTTYPTYLAAEVLSLVLCWMFLRGKKVNYKDIAVCTAVGAAVYFVTDARLGAACTLLFLAGLFLYIFIQKQRAMKNKTFELPSWVQTIFACSSVLCCACIFLLTVLYHSQSGMLTFMNGILNGRLRLGKLGIDMYGISPWGQYIPMTGAGSTTKSPQNYFYIDSSYIFYLLGFGIVILIMILIVMMLIAFRAIREGNLMLLWILVIIAIYGMVEDKMLIITINPFVWLLLADMEEKRIDSKSMNV